MQVSKVHKTSPGKTAVSGARRRVAGAGPDTGRAAPGEAAHARAYAVLKEAVLAGNFRQGEVVTLRSLAKQLGVGEMPVREALRRLTSEGAFESLPNRSARVPVLTRRQVEQLLELREDLEGKAAALAARNITLVQIEHLRALQQGIEQSIARGDSRAHTSLNMAFHFEIYRIADNPILIPLIQMLWLRMAPLVANTVPLLTSKPGVFRKTATENHERLLAAFQARDPVAAQDAMRRDLLGLTKVPGYWESLELTTD
jgi:DNA-binding GntR family transcriptional regulator